MTGLVRTVRGDLPGGELGVTDAHDHLLLESPVIPGSPLNRQSAAATAARGFRAAGGQALVQWTPPGMGRHAEWLPGIAQRAGLRIIAATGLHQARHYTSGTGPPRWPATLGPEDLAALFTEELTGGMRADNGQPGPADPVRAGMIKVAAGYHGTDEHERRALAAAGAAHRATGAPVCVHLELGTHGPAVLTALAAAGVPAGHVILGHLARNPDFGLHSELAAAGAYLAYDGPRRDTHSTDWRLGDLIRAMLNAGYGDRILLGADTPTADRRDPHGGPGPAALLTDTAAQLGRYVGEDAMHAILAVNPGRAFAWHGADTRSASHRSPAGRSCEGLHLTGTRVPRAAHRAVGPHHHRPGQVVADPLAVARAQDDDEANQARERPAVGQGVEDQADPADGQLRHARRAASLADDAQAEQLHAQRLPVLPVREDDPVHESYQHEDDEGDNAAENADERAAASVERYRYESGDEPHEESVDQVLHHPAPRHAGLLPCYLSRPSLLAGRVALAGRVTLRLRSARLRGDRPG